MSTPIVFWTLAAIATIAALLAVALPLWRRAPLLAPDQQQRVAVYRDRKREIERERDAGRLTEADAQAALQRLPVELSETLSVADDLVQPAGLPGRHRLLALLVALTIPIGAFSLYNAVGMPQILSLDPSLVRGESTPAQLDEAIATLKQRIDANAGDLEALALLAQAYRVKGNLPAAIDSYERVAKLLPNDRPESARLLADFAETLVVSRQGAFDGQPMSLIERALRINPDDQKSLGLYGAGLYRSGKPAQALAPLRKLQQSLPAGEQQQAIASLVQRIESELSRPAASGPTVPTANGAPLISGSVRIADALLARHDRNATLYIVAREAGGPPMPVAVLKLSGATLPQNFALDDGHSMTGERKLSTMSAVTIEARLSASGNAIRQSGDLIGSSAPIKPGQRDLQIVIDHTVP